MLTKPHVFFPPSIRKLTESPSSWCSAVTCWLVCPSDLVLHSKSMSAMWRCCRGPTSWNARTSEVCGQMMPLWPESACNVLFHLDPTTHFMTNICRGWVGQNTVVGLTFTVRMTRNWKTSHPTSHHGLWFSNGFQRHPHGSLFVSLRE